MAKLTEQQQSELEALAQMPDEEIDFSDISEGPLNPSNLRRGAFYVPVKKELTLAMDEYVLDWFSAHKSKKETRDEAINQVLLDHIRRCQAANANKAKDVND